MKLPRTTPRAAVARWIPVVATAGMLVFSPLAAAAAGLADDPGPVDWPSVKELGGTDSGSDPKPVDPPKVANPDRGTATDPGPVDWPAPDQQ